MNISFINSISSQKNQSKINNNSSVKSPYTTSFNGFGLSKAGDVFKKILPSRKSPLEKAIKYMKAGNIAPFRDEAYRYYQKSANVLLKSWDKLNITGHKQYVSASIGMAKCVASKSEAGALEIYSSIFNNLQRTKSPLMKDKNTIIDIYQHIIGNAHLALSRGNHKSAKDSYGLALKIVEFAQKNNVASFVNNNVDSVVLLNRKINSINELIKR